MSIALANVSVRIGESTFASKDETSEFFFRTRQSSAFALANVVFSISEWLLWACGVLSHEYTQRTCPKQYLPLRVLDWANDPDICAEMERLRNGRTPLSANKRNVITGRVLQIGAIVFEQQKGENFRLRKADGHGPPAMSWELAVDIASYLVRDITTEKKVPTCYVPWTGVRSRKAWNGVLLRAGPDADILDNDPGDVVRSSAPYSSPKPPPPRLVTAASAPQSLPLQTVVTAPRISEVPKSQPPNRQAVLLRTIDELITGLSDPETSTSIGGLAAAVLGVMAPLRAQLVAAGVVPAPPAIEDRSKVLAQVAKLHDDAIQAFMQKLGEQATFLKNARDQIAIDAEGLNQRRAAHEAERQAFNRDQIAWKSDADRKEAELSEQSKSLSERSAWLDQRIAEFEKSEREYKVAKAAFDAIVSTDEADRNVLWDDLYAHEAKVQAREKDIAKREQAVADKEAAVLALKRAQGFELLALAHKKTIK